MTDSATSLHYIGVQVNRKVNSNVLKKNLDLNVESAVQNNPFSVGFLGDFYVKSSNWCKIDITTSEGKAIENISPQFGLHQVTNEPIHILESSSLCVDMIFTSQQNLITESVVHSSLYPKSHHPITFAKSDLEILFTPPYFRNGWHYQDANIDFIREQFKCLIGGWLS